MRLSARLLASTLVPAITLAGLTVLSAPAQAASGGLVINQVYGGGGNSGAAYTNDFVELFNPGSTAVSVSGMSLQYRSATATTVPGSTNVNALSGSVPAHGYFLIQLAAGSTPVAALPTPDDIPASPINMSGTGGQVYLVNGTAPIAAQTNAAAPWSFASSVVDFVGWGSTTTVFEGSAHAGATTNGTSISRASTHADTDDNAADFGAAATPVAHNSSVIEGGGGSTAVSLAAIPNQTATAGTAITEIDPQASNGTGTLTWSVDNLPAGLSFNTATGAITGTPTTSGVSNVTVHVTDSASTPTSDSKSFTFTVTAPNGTGGPAAPHVLISEVYTDGGYTGASYLNDFVELYNPTGSAVNLSGYSIGYGADLRGTGTYPLQLSSTPLSGTIPSHGYFLIQGHQDSKAIGSALPTADLTWPSAPDFFYAAGLVVLSDQSTPPVPSTGNVANTAHIVDALGYGADANTFEGMAQGTDLGATTSAYRSVSGTDTDNNHADFTVGTPSPTNAAGTTGGGGTSGCTQSNTTPSIAEVQGTNTDTSPYAGCAVTVQGVVTADYTTGGFNGFTVQTAGTGGSTDATPGASDAVFVYGSAAAAQVTVGESVSVAATVQEFSGETELTSPTVTQVTPALAAVTPAQLSWSDLDTDAKREAHEAELLAPQGDYTVTDNYDLNYYGTIVLAADTTKPLFDPTDVATPGSADAQATAAYNAAHSITLDDGSSWNYSTTHTGDPLPWLTKDHSVTIGAAVDFGSQGVILDYRNAGWNFQPTHQVTDTGTDVATFTDMRGTVNAAPQSVGGDIKLATFNMENYFVMTGQQFVTDGFGSCTYYNDRQGNPLTDKSCSFNAAHGGGAGPRGAATTDSFNRQLAKEVWGVNHLGASIVSLEEVENSAKYGEDRDHALSVFVDALNAQAGAGTWAYIPTGSLTQPDIDVQDVIRSAFIYKPADVTPVGAASILSNDSGNGQPFSIAREPLAQEFKGAGEPDSSGFLVVSNHFKSKGADASGLFNDCGTGKGDAENTDPAADQGGFNCTRVHEANDMSTWAEGLAGSDGIAPIFMLGDFNAYTHEDPMEALYAKGYTDLQTHENGADAKATYSYGGLEGSLDHVLGNAAALAMVTGADVWQIDGQEPVAYVYSRYNYNVTDLFDPTNAFGTSDHDPEIVGIDLPTIEPVASTVTGADVSQVYGKTATMHVSVTATGATPTGTVTLTSGTTQLGQATLGADGTADVQIAAGSLPASSTAYPVTITYSGDSNVAGGTGTASLTVTHAAVTVTGTPVTHVYGAASTMHVTVAADGATPSGTVTVKAGQVSLGQATLGADGTADVSIAPSVLAASTTPYAVTVTYSGDSNVAAGSASSTVTITRATPTVTGASATQAYGSTATMKVTVTATGAHPTGQVVLTSGSTQLGMATLGSDGTATVQLALKALTPRAAAYPVSISYSGDGNIVAGTGTGSLTVTKGHAKVAAKVTTKRIVVKRTKAGVAVTVTGANGVLATGKVVVSGGGIKPASGTLSQGRVTVHLPAFAKTGKKRLTVTYGGSNLLLGGTSTLMVTVVKG